MDEVSEGGSQVWVLSVPGSYTVSSRTDVVVHLVSPVRDEIPPRPPRPSVEVKVSESERPLVVELRQTGR